MFSCHYLTLSFTSYAYYYYFSTLYLSCWACFALYRLYFYKAYMGVTQTKLKAVTVYEPRAESLRSWTVGVLQFGLRHFRQNMTLRVVT